MTDTTYVTKSWESLVATVIDLQGEVNKPIDKNRPPLSSKNTAKILRLEVFTAIRSV